MKANDGLACRLVCCGSLVLLGWWLRGALGTKAPQPSGGTPPPPAARPAFAHDAVPAASTALFASAAPVASADRTANAPVDFKEPPTLPKPAPNHTAAASALGQDPTLASQAGAADLGKGAVLDADR